MKIVICAYGIPFQDASGPNVWLRRLAEYFKNTEVDITVLFIHFGVEDDCTVIRYFKKNDLKYRSIGQSQVKYTDEKIKWILQQVKDIKPDIYIPNVVAPAMYAGKWVKKMNIPVIGVIHSDDEFHHTIVNEFIKQKTFLFDSVVCVSNFLTNYVSKNNPFSVNITTIPCGSPVPDNKLAFHSLPVKLIYVGRIIQKQKRIKEVTNSFCTITSKNANITASIYGDGPEAEEVNQIISDTRCNCTIYHGPIESSQIQNILAKHHIFILLSDFEGLPIALLEAMGVGLVPVCYAEKSGINEVIQHGVNGIIIHDRKDLEKEVRALVNNPDKWEKLSKAAWETVHQNYSTTINNEKWKDLWQHHIDRKKSCTDIKIPEKIKLPDVPYGFKREDFRLTKKPGLDIGKVKRLIKNTLEKL